MFPTLSHDDTIPVDRRYQQWQGNGIYVLIVAGQLPVKRLSLALDGVLNVISDNPAHQM